MIDSPMGVVLLGSNRNRVGSTCRGWCSHMIDSPMGVVLLGSNRNKVGSTCRGRCSYSRLNDMSA
jgi:hypothetical protein